MAKFSQFGQRHDKVSEKDLHDKFNEYKDMNKQDLHSTLLSEVAKQKNAGNFDYTSLKNMVDSLSGVLPADDYKKVLSLLESLK